MDGYQQQPNTNTANSKRVILFFLAILLAGVLNAFLAPVFIPRLNLISVLLQGGSWVALFLGARFLLGEFLVATLILTIIIGRIFPERKFIKIFFLVLAGLILVYGARLVFSQYIIKSSQSSFYGQATGMKTGLEFSKKIKLIESDHAKSNLKMKGNKVVWTEQTKEFPNFSRNEWEAFLFEFAESQKSGETIKLSNVSGAESGSIKDLFLTDNGVYWLQGGNIYYQKSTDSASRKLIKQNAGKIAGVSNNYLVYSHLTKATSYGNISFGIYVFDFKTGQEDNLGDLSIKNVPDGSSVGQTPTLILSGDKFIFEPSTAKGENIYIYDIKSKKLDGFKLPTGDDFALTDFNGEYVGYFDFGSIEENYTVYSIPKNEIIFTKIRELAGKTQIDNGFLYYSPDTNTSDKSIMLDGLITKYSLTSDIEETISLNLDGKTLADWTIDRNFLSYFSGEPEEGPSDKRYNEEVWLQRINKIPGNKLSN